MNEIKVNISKNIESSIFVVPYEKDVIFNMIGKQVKNSEEKKFLFVIDSEVYRLYKEVIDLVKIGVTKILTLEHGEENKNMESVIKIINELNLENFSKKDYVVALGGGVIGDITSFTSSIYKRGINLIQIPTTLLSMLDSSVGGKTGVNYTGIKNLIGTFKNPNLVLITPEFLKTLNYENLISGYLEGLKHSILSSKKDYMDFQNQFDNFINKNFEADITKIIAKNIEYKLSVVTKDPFEEFGKRKILNYGHTFGHALETYMDFKFGHGVCVGFGMLYANILAKNLNILKDDFLSVEVSDFLKKVLLDYKLDNLDFETIYTSMKQDKKNDNGKITFVLMKNFGEPLLYEVLDEKILKKTFNDFVKLL